MGDLNLASLTATDSQASAASSTATVSAISGKLFQIVGFDGSSNDQPFSVTLNFGDSTKLTMYGSADTSVGRDFGDNGPVTAKGEDITVVTTPASSGNCNANIIYKIIF